MEGEGCRQGEEEIDNNWGGAIVHELPHLFIRAVTRKNTDQN